MGKDVYGGEYLLKSLENGIDRMEQFIKRVKFMYTN